MKLFRLSLELTAILTLAGPSIGHAAPEAEGVSTFADVPPMHYAYPWIEVLFAEGMTAGCGTDPLIFCPDSAISRAQMAVFLVRGIYGSAFDPPPATGTVFADVPADHPFGKWIEQLFADDGIPGGCETGPACPDASVTRDEMAVFLLLAKYGTGYTPPPATGAIFDDVPISHPFASWIEELAAEGVTAGCGDGNYCPDASVTRGQMAIFLARAFEFPL